jgi:four helix bundle protein
VTSRHVDLRAYQLAAELADDLFAVVERLPSLVRWSIGMQLIRSAGAIGANIAEGFGRSSEADIRRFLVMARGSLLETEHWIGRAESAGYMDDGRYDEALAELGRVLNGLIASRRLH